MTASDAAIARLKDWFVAAALPLWAARGYDHARGGFYESLDFDGRPVTGQIRRVRVQARQIHTFSQAGLRGWFDGAEELAAKGFDYFLSAACPDEGLRGCVHHLSDDGTIIDDRRDLYDQAFLLLACASRWEAAKDQRALDLAERTLAFLDKELASPHGGWLEDDKGTLPRRQNPHMHLFEAFMALYAATQDDRYFDLANIVLNDCFSAFYDLAEGVIMERFNEKLESDTTRSVIEPGHMFEWVWLLARYENIADAGFSDERNTLYTRGAHFGADENFFGFIKNTVDITAPKNRDAKRLWPQTEYLKASCTQAAGGDLRAGERITPLINDLFSTYFNVDLSGLWHDEFDALGAPVVSDVPASILYHLFEAVAETVHYQTTMDAS